MIDRQRKGLIHFYPIAKVFAVGLFVAMVLILFSPSSAQAQYCTCGVCCDCGSIESDHEETRENINCHTTQDFNDYRSDFFLDEYWYDTVMPGFQKMTDQITSTAFKQVEILGMFFDADLQLEAQRRLQKGQAQAHKDYIPSENICKFGTMSRSLLASEARSKMTQLALAKRSQDRQLGKGFMAAARGPEFDKKSRFDQFRRVYCNENDNGGHMDLICPGTGGNGRSNLDINYTATIDSKLTLNMEIEDGEITTAQQDEEDVLALQNNLYAHDVFSRITPIKLTRAANQGLYLDIRSIVAKRSVAENSYNAIAGMKAMGTGSSYDYLVELMLELGMNEDEIPYYLASLGERPSYYAQMEVLTKKIYQDPAFIVNLIDKPANVARQEAIMESFELMQQRDIYNSLTRSEMLMAVLLEMETMKHRERIQNNIRSE